MSSGDLIRVLEVYGEIGYENLFITRIVCRLEDGREFILERVPFDIVLALKRMNGEVIDDDRERIVDVLLSMPEVRHILGRNLEKIVIDHLDHNTGVYSATAIFNDNGLIVKRKMVPSHAIFLAVLTNRPIYVKRELVDEQEELMNIDFEFPEYRYTEEEGEYDEEIGEDYPSGLDEYE